MSFWLCFVIVDIRSTENAAILGRAVVYFPQAGVLWSMCNKVKCLVGDSPNRDVLECTLVANSENEKIWPAATKMEAESGKLRVAREWLIHARIVADTEKVHRTILPPILVLTFQVSIDLDEMGRRQISRPTLHHPLCLSQTLIKFELPRRRRLVRHRHQSLPPETALCTLVRLLEKVCLVTRTTSCARSSLSASKNVQEENLRQNTRNPWDIPSIGLLWSMPVLAEAMVVKKTKNEEILTVQEDDNPSGSRVYLRGCSGRIECSGWRGIGFGVVIGVGAAAWDGGGSFPVRFVLKV
jgi:hypothetical protein